MNASEGCVILAVDGTPSLGASMDLVEMTVGGPIGQYLAAVKLNDVLDSEFGQLLVAEISGRYPNLSVFVDRKLADVSATCINVLDRYVTAWYPQGRGFLATVSLHASPKTFLGITGEFPELEIIAMGVPTDWTPEQCFAHYGMTAPACMERWLNNLVQEVRKASGVDELRPCEMAIASYDMLSMMAESFPWATCITPGIRDEWMLKEHQERVTSTYEALVAGAKYLVMGSQLTKGNKERNISAEKSQEMTAEMIKQALLAG